MRPTEAIVCVLKQQLQLTPSGAAIAGGFKVERSGSDAFGNVAVWRPMARAA
jgi:hypothetical protein